ncbi:MAG: SusC/RagA family TonB-linked outer membrane protein [Chitinophagaceae bacterium]|nr:SusC/RagA family TonB-linked outer membrane protein [Chitinophagaceae bacterium]
MKKQIRISIALLLSLFVSLVSVAQEKKTVSGTVSDSKGSALQGAAITEKGTSNTVVSDAAGAFRISVAPRATLQVTFVGFQTREIAVGEAGSYSVQLSESQNTLEEVVVTSLGISREQKALGYAVSTVKAEQLTQAGTPNFATALYGKAPGVRIGTTPGGATSAVNITIRGVNSITGKNQPLIVLDGVPIRDGEVRNNDYWGDQRLRGNGLLDLNPEDIESITILKGASAAALYGSEAVNGVVLVTTKSGKGKKGFNLDVTANYSRDEVAYLPRYQNVRGPGAPLHVSNGGQNEDGFVYVDTDGDGTPETRGVGGFTINFGPKFDGQPTLTWDGKVRPYVAQEDNYKGLFRAANNSSITAAISQGSENSSLRFSLTRQTNQGVSLGAENQKNIANLNTSFKLGKRVTTDLMVNFINQNTKNRPYSIDRMINNFTGMMGRFDNSDWYLDKYKSSLGYRFTTGTEQSLTPDENIIYNGFRADIADYVWRVKEHHEEEKSNRVIASLTNTWQIVDALRLRTRIATDFTSMKTEIRQATEAPLAFRNSGYFGLNNYNSTLVYGDALLTYSKFITPDIELNVMGGYTATKQNDANLTSGTRTGLSVENWFDLKASVDLPTVNSTRLNLVKDAFLGTINANYKDFLFVEGTLRRDRTSVMNPKDNAFVYPSVNSSLILSEAFNLPSVFTYAKIRGSWGIVGNYPDIYAANIAYDQNTLGVQETGGRPVLYTTISPTFGNDGIRPEEKHEFEFGLETRLFSNRMGVEVSYYNAQIRDQILPLTIPSSAGATSVLTNIGTLRNKGVEIAINGTPVQSGNFKWDVAINFAKNVNVVEKLATGSNELLHADYDGNAAQLKSVIGQAMGDFYIHPVARNEKGEAIIEDIGLNKLADTLVRAGNTMPKMVGGISNTFAYKNFSLDVMVDFRLGGYVMPTGINWMISRGLLEESLKYMDAESGGLRYYVDGSGKGVQTSGDQGPNGEKVFNDGMLIPGVTQDGNPNTNVISQAFYYWNVYNWGGPQYSYSRYELYVQKNSYVKMRELALNYNLPTKLAAKIGAKRLQLSVFGRNLFYIYRTIKDMDAEQTTAGSRWFQNVNNAGTNPSTRSYGVMLRTSF